MLRSVALGRGTRASPAALLAPRGRKEGPPWRRGCSQAPPRLRPNSPRASRVPWRTGRVLLLLRLTHLKPDFLVGLRFVFGPDYLVYAPLRLGLVLPEPFGSDVEQPDQVSVVAHVGSGVSYGDEIKRNARLVVVLAGFVAQMMQGAQNAALKDRTVTRRPQLPTVHSPTTTCWSAIETACWRAIPTSCPKR